MKTLCRQYISDVKSLFPIVGKEERIFLAKLKKTIENYCDEEEFTSITELYDSFGQPNEIVNSYYSDVDTQYVIRKIKTAKAVKFTIMAFLLAYLISVIIYGIKTYTQYEKFIDSMVYYEEITIE